MEDKLMPQERLAEIIADAAVRAATNITGVFRNERMTWTEQGVHAAAWNAVMHDRQVLNAVRMIHRDGFGAGWQSSGEGWNGEYPLNEGDEQAAYDLWAERNPES